MAVSVNEYVELKEKERRAKRMAFRKFEQREPQQKSNSTPIGGKGKSTMSAVDNGTKTVLRGSFDGEALIANIRAAMDHPDNDQPGRVAIEVHRTEKEGDYLPTVRPLLPRKGFGNNGGGNGYAPKQRFSEAFNQEVPPQRPAPRSFQERYEQEEDEASQVQETQPVRTKAPARKGR